MKIYKTIRNAFLLKWKAVIRAVGLFTPVLVLIGCGYSLTGYGNQIPEHIRTIHIADFDNKTANAQVERYVTFAVRDEFLKRSRLRMTQSAETADAKLEGVITGFLVTPQSITNEGSANIYRLQITLSVRLIDLTSHKIIFEGPNINFNDTYEVDSSAIEGGDVDFFSQETAKLKDIADRFAQSIVSTILENF